MYRIYLLRHGKAEEHSSEQADGERKLTEEGIHEMRVAAVAMKRLSIDPDIVYTSPLRRAAETAQIVCDELGISGDRFQVYEGLAAGEIDADVLNRMLESLGGNASVMLVGHEPTMSGLIGMLCGGRAEMKKGALACLECYRVTDGGAVLKYLVTPRLLAARS
jgi:phosphohistidine phosphatase